VTALSDPFMTEPAIVAAIVVALITGWFVHQRWVGRGGPGRTWPGVAARRLSSHPRARAVPGRGLMALVTLGLTVPTLVAWRWWVVSRFGWSLSGIIFTVGGLVVMAYTLAVLRGADRLSAWAPVASADACPTSERYEAPRIVAVIPSYNEDQAALDEAISAILRQQVRGATIPIHIYVVDDGSTTPVRPWGQGHPRVTWIRQANAGKREAQATAIRRMQADGRDAEYILTVDSDSRISGDAVEECLRLFRDDSVMGVTGMIIVRGPTRNLLSRLTDMEIVCGILTTRRARSAGGVVVPCSGALSMYRAFVVVDNLVDYVASGTYSDDRRLAHYCLRYGRTVGTDRAVVDTLMPVTVRGTWKQRVRWYKGFWDYLPTEARDLPPLPLMLRWWSTISATILPIFLVWALIQPVLGRALPWYPFALWLVLNYIQNLMYLRRPGIPLWTRIWSWGLLTPLMVLFSLLLVRPAMYAAAWQVYSGGRTVGTWDGDRYNASPPPAGAPAIA
jgi:hyaluronan synthase